MSKWSIAFVASLLALSAMVGLTGCSALSGSRPATVSLPSAAPTARSHSGVAHPSGGSGSGGAGSITVALTQPVTISGHVNDTVTCTTGREYRAVAAPAEVGNDTVSLQVVVSGYSGPGSYSAIVTASITPTGSTATSVAGLPGIPVSLTSTGGSVNLSANGSDGRTIAGSFSWACS